MNFNTPGMGTYNSIWQSHGYSGNGNVVELIHSARGRAAIVAGSSFQVFSDIESAQQRLNNPLIFAVNDIGMFLPKIDHWVSLHRNNLVAWRAVRWLHPHSDSTVYHTYESVDPDMYSWNGLNPIFALSGYFAMQIAYIMGCEPIVLCGCPGSSARRFFEVQPRLDGVYDTNGGVRQQLTSEMSRLPEFKNVVRSMSGWTREYFGGLSTWRPSQRLQQQS